MWPSRNVSRADNSFEITLYKRYSIAIEIISLKYSAKILGTGRYTFPSDMVATILKTPLQN